MEREKERKYKQRRSKKSGARAGAFPIWYCTVRTRQRASGADDHLPALSARDTNHNTKRSMCYCCWWWWWWEGGRKRGESGCRALLGKMDGQTGCRPSARRSVKATRFSPPSARRQGVSREGVSSVATCGAYRLETASLPRPRSPGTSHVMYGDACAVLAALCQRNGSSIRPARRG